VAGRTRPQLGAELPADIVHLDRKLKDGDPPQKWRFVELM
jgi:hypothetical protein